MRWVSALHGCTGSVFYSYDASCIVIAAIIIAITMIHTTISHGNEIEVRRIVWAQLVARLILVVARLVIKPQKDLYLLVRGACVGRSWPESRRVRTHVRTVKQLLQY